MRCHFNLIDQHEVIVDRKGVEVANFEQALAEVLSVIREMREEDPAAARDWAGWQLEITDESSVLLTSIGLDDPALRYQG
jgi:hypothetical protein